MLIAGMFNGSSTGGKNERVKIVQPVPVSLEVRQKGSMIVGSAFGIVDFWLIENGSTSDIPMTTE
jgi:hypothetical protein